MATTLLERSSWVRVRIECRIDSDDYTFGEMIDDWEKLEPEDRESVYQRYAHRVLSLTQPVDPPPRRVDGR